MMKSSFFQSRFWSFLAAIVLFLAALTPAPLPAQASTIWSNTNLKCHSTTSSPDSYCSTDWTRIALAKDGTPYVGNTSWNDGNVYKYTSNAGWVSIGKPDPSGAVHNVKVGPDGTVFAVSDNGNVYMTSNGGWTKIGSLPMNGQSAITLAIDRAGNLWASPFGGGLYVYQNGTFQYRGAPSAKSTTGTTIRVFAESIAFGPDGTVWVVNSYYGLFYNKTPLTTTSYTFVQTPYDKHYADIAGSTLAFDKNDVLWMVGGTAGPQKMVNGSWVDMATPPPNQTKSGVYDIGFESDNTPWVATSSYNGTGPTVARLIDGKWVSMGNPHGATAMGGITIDPQDGIWVIGGAYAGHSPKVPKPAQDYGWEPLQNAIGRDSSDYPSAFDLETKRILSSYGSSMVQYYDMSQNPVVYGGTFGTTAPKAASRGKYVYTVANSGTSPTTYSDYLFDESTKTSKMLFSSAKWYKDGLGNLYYAYDAGASGNGGGFSLYSFDLITSKGTLLYQISSESNYTYVVPMIDGAGVWVIDLTNGIVFNSITGNKSSGLNSQIGAMPAPSTGSGFSTTIKYPRFAAKDEISGINANGYRWIAKSDGTLTEQYIGTQFTAGSGLYPTATGELLLKGSNNDLFSMDPETLAMTDTGWSWYTPNLSQRSLDDGNSTTVTAYAPGIYLALNTDGYSNASQAPSGYVIGTAQVATPILDSTSSTTSTITLAVTTDNGVAGYSFDYKLLDASGNVVQSSTGNSVPTYTFGNLPSGTNFDVQTRITNIFGGNSGWVDLGSLSTTPEAPPQPTVTIAGAGWAAKDGNNKITATWKPVAGATGYNVLLLNGNDVLQTFDAGSATSLTITVPDQTHDDGFVDASDKYVVAVQAYNISNNQQNPSLPSPAVTLDPLNQTDTTAPTWASSKPVVINGGQMYTSNPTVSIAINALDEQSGISKVMVSNDNYVWQTFSAGDASQGLTNAINYSVTDSWQLAPGQGQKNVYVKLVDLAGNVSEYEAGYIGLTVNTTPPTVSIAINAGQAQTSDPAVTLSISAADPVFSSSQLQMQFSTDGSNWTANETFANSKAWTLTSSNAPGSYPIFVRVTNPTGISAVASATIYFLPSGTGPSVGGDGTTTGGVIGGGYTSVNYGGLKNVYVTSTNTVSLDFSGTGAKYASVSTDNISFSNLVTTSTPLPITLPAGDGLKVVYVKLANVQSVAALGTVGKVYFLVDTTAPVLKLSGANGANATSGASFTVQTDASDNTSTGQLQYQVNSGTWQPLPGDGKVTLAGFTAHSGRQTFSITVRDLAGNQSTQQISFWSI